MRKIFFFGLLFGLLGGISAATAQSNTVFLPLILKNESDAPSATGPSISAVDTNVGAYPANKVPRYEKFEITFTVETVAENPQLPYDAAPPPGLAPEIGISVDALFTPDDWQTVYTQPAFYYQEFLHEVKGKRDWIYPTGSYRWKVRFAPPQTGLWQYKLVARDKHGIAETEPASVDVVASDNKGFVRVSERDQRYFEFENGEPFLGLGYNLTFGQADWDNPIVSNQPRLEKLHLYGLTLFRTWLSHWGIYTSAWNPWNSPLPERHAQYIPYTSLTTQQAYPGSEVSMRLIWDWNPAMFLGFMKQSPAVKRDTAYRVSVRYLLPQPLNGPRIDGHPYGLVIKTGGWLTGPGSWPDNIYGFSDPGTGTVVSEYVAESPLDETDTAQWAVLEGRINVTNKDFLPNLYLVLENVKKGEQDNGTGSMAYIDRVEIREDFGNGKYGPNIVSKPWMAHHLYYDQRHSYAFDKFLELAEANDIYLKLVVLEKNEWILNRIDFQGNTIPDSSLCRDGDSSNDPEKCPGNRWFYGNWRQTTKVRWLQQAWWRYLQARWGYSSHIHSWELLNEGDPWHSAHYTLADEFGKYMKQFAPNDHLVTTSFWHSFPGEGFWANDKYPNVDYADLHAYAEGSADIAGNSLYHSERYGANQSSGAGKPLVRGETGFGDGILQDTTGVWLHNYIWAGMNGGGMYEQYWYGKEHIEQQKTGNDLRYHYRPFLNFMTGIGIPLNNGNYQSLAADVTESQLRIVGQKDVTNGCAHLWIQNKNNTWKNAIETLSIAPVSGTIDIPGFQPNQSYDVEWWDTYQPDMAQQITGVTTVAAMGDGSLSLPIPNLATDVAVKIVDSNGCDD